MKYVESVWSQHKRFIAIPQSDDDMFSETTKMLERFNELVQAFVVENTENQANLNSILITLFALNLLVIAIAILLVNQTLVKPLKKLSFFIRKLFLGKLGNNIQFNSNDEIGIAAQQLKKLDKNLQQATQFARSINQSRKIRF